MQSNMKKRGENGGMSGTLPPSPDGGTAGTFGSGVDSERGSHIAISMPMVKLGPGGGVAGGIGVGGNGGSDEESPFVAPSAPLAEGTIASDGAGSSLPVPASMRGPLVALAYGMISLGIVFFNKMTLAAFPRRNFLSMVQMIVTIFALRVLRSRGLIELADFKIPTARKFLPVSLMSLANILSGLLATELLTVPMFSVLRRVSTLFTITAEYLFLSTEPKSTDVYAVLFWVAGAAISGWGDLYFTVNGYMAAAANSTATALYYVLLRRVNEDTKLSSFSLLYYNSILSLPFQFILFWASGEHEGLMEFEGWSQPAFCGVFAFTLFLGAILNYAVFLCVQVNSPTVTSVVGQIKSVVQSLLGVLVFGVAVTSTGWVGVAVSTAGCVYYVHAKINSILSGAPPPQ